MSHFEASLRVQSWCLCTASLLAVCCRLVSRRLRLGSWRKLKWEDGWMCLAMACFVVAVQGINDTAKYGDNFTLSAEAAALRPEAVGDAIYGSKMVFVTELAQLTCLWSVKGCLLLLYYRLSEFLPSRRNTVVAVAVYCATTYVVLIALFLGYWCRPIHEYWVVPVRISQCATYYDHMIFATVCNISSDLMLLALPIAIIGKTQLETKKKLTVIGMLSLGVFNILTVILNRYSNFSHPNNLGYLYWYVGEGATALMVANIPHCWPLLQHLLQLGPWTRPQPSKTPQGLYDGRQPRMGRHARASASPAGHVWTGPGGTAVGSPNLAGNWSKGTTARDDGTDHDADLELDSIHAWHGVRNEASVRASPPTQTPSAADSPDRSRSSTTVPEACYVVNVTKTVNVSYH